MVDHRGWGHRRMSGNLAPLQWKRITSLPVRSKAEAVEKIDWYAMRWKIETFHKILKSGCRAEDSRLRTAERLTNLIAIYCILSSRIFRVTMIALRTVSVPSKRPSSTARRYGGSPSRYFELAMTRPCCGMMSLCSAFPTPI